MTMGNLWAAYVAALLDMHRLSEAQMVTLTGVQQGTLNRWKNGKTVPNRAGDVADFARKLEHNPLEAFVAAGMLTEEEAGTGLLADERRLLADVRRSAKFNARRRNEGLDPGERAGLIDSIHGAGAAEETLGWPSSDSSDPPRKITRVAKRSQEKAGAPEDEG